MSNLTFSGHDSFHCRQFWLKKAFDFTSANSSFSSADATLELGVGKNMVTAIRYWSQRFQMLDDNGNTSIAKQLLSDDGWDPYLEDHGSLWLLHHLLVSSGRASTFSIIFNELIRERPEFITENYLAFINQRKEGEYNQNTLKKDFTVFYRTYFADFDAADIEEGFTGILTELNLLSQIKKTYIDKDGKPKEHDVWLLNRSVRNEIPLHILLYGIVDRHPNDLSISFDQLYNDADEIGSVFALSKEGLTIVLQRIADELKYNITFSNEAGIRELQLKRKVNKNQILKDYYGK